MRLIVHWKQPRHTGAGRYPAIKNVPRSGQNRGVAPLARDMINRLDTGLRRYDGLLEHPG